MLIVFTLLGPAPALSQTVLKLNNGAASVRIPHGTPEKLKLDGDMGTMARGMFQALFKQVNKVPDERTTVLMNDFVAAFLSGEAWMASDGSSGQSFSVLAFPIPSSIATALKAKSPVVCPPSLHEPVEHDGMRTECRNVAKTAGGGFELTTTVLKFGRSVIWTAIDSGYIYQLQYHSLDDATLTSLALSPPERDDEQLFLNSFELAVPTPAQAARH